MPCCFRASAQPGQGPGDGHSLVACRSSHFHNLPVGRELVHVGGGFERRHLAVVDRGHALGFGVVNQNEPAAAEPGGVGFNDTKGKGRGHGSVDGIAAFLQDLHPDLRGQRVRRRHHTVFGFHRAGRPGRHHGKAQDHQKNRNECEFVRHAHNLPPLFAVNGFDGLLQISELVHNPTTDFLVRHDF